INIVQLAKPLLSKKEITILLKTTLSDDLQIRAYQTKKKEAFKFLTEMIKALQFPTNHLQNCCYLYQRFYLFNSVSSFPNMHYEVAITSLFMSMKTNDYIKKLNMVLTEANKIRGLQVSTNEFNEQRSTILKLERKFLEFQSLDFRNFSSEDMVIKLLKFMTVPKHITFITWSILNDSYLTELFLQFPSHYIASIVHRLSVSIFNELHDAPVKETQLIDKLNKTEKLLKIDSRMIFDGINELLEYYLQNYESSFLMPCLSELKLECDPKHIINDVMLNIKIELSDTITKKDTAATTPGTDKVDYNEDLFFKVRDYDIGKNGSIRFLYNKKNYVDEV
ncbi:hypothetical protein CANARDRAFT_181515, partial [[Candida] arabinofermentans NRRL YB-2248]